MKISAHKLEGVEFRNSPNQGGAMKVRAVILHYTAGTRAGPAINTFTNPRTKVSAHLVIDRDGSITQLVPFNRVAWHAGVSELPGMGAGCNRYSVGIELVNRGFYTEDSGIFVDLADYELIDGRHWQRYPEPQLAALEKVLTALWGEYSPTVLSGHQFITTRKVDPGPAFPWARFSTLPTYLGLDDKR